MSHSWWWLAVDALAVYRLAILITQDTIMEPLRQAVGRWAFMGFVGNGRKYSGFTSRRKQYLSTLITCPWCLSVWFGAGAVAATRLIPGQWQYLAAVLAMSAVAGLLAERTEH